MSAENGAKMDNLGLFNEVAEFVSIRTDELGFGKYEFIDLTSDEIEYLKSIIETLENDKDVYLCARGDSKKGKHTNFINKQLYYFFIVSDKAGYHKNVAKPEDLYKHIRMGEGLIDNIKYLVNKCNAVLKKNTNRDEVCGKISQQFILDRENESEKVQESWKFLLLGFLHNMGVDYGDEKDYDFKPYSGLVSVTHGQGKYDIAKKFATDGRRKGIIYTYILRRDLENYLETEKMYKLLKNYGVECSEDPNREIMILNGLYPHNAIGFFVVEKKSIKRFILNCWFYRQIKADLDSKSKYEYKNGVLINQKPFLEAAKNLGYNRYFTRDHVIDINSGELQSNIRMDKVLTKHDQNSNKQNGWCT